MTAFQNGGITTIAATGAPSPATSGTTFTVAAGAGASFLNPATVGSFPLTVWAPGTTPSTAANNFEVVTATAISTDTWTVVRAQEGTTAQPIAAGWYVAATITAGALSSTYAPKQSQFHVRAYGAIMDGVQVVGGSISSGSAILTATSNVFPSTCVGRTIFVTAAGPAGGFLVTTIASWQSATQVTLAAAASTTVASGAVFRFGTDNLAAFVATVSAVVAAGGGRVVMDGGKNFYLSSGTPFTIPVNVPVVIEGIGWAFTASDALLTQVMRIPSSTNPLVSAVGTGAGALSRVYPTIRNLQFHGGDGPGTVVDIRRASQVTLEDVIIGFSSGTLLNATEWWNAECTNCQFHNGGSGTGTPAVQFNASQDSDGASGNTISMVACEWEGNGGTDLYVTGNTSGAPTGQDWTVGVLLSNIKMERDTGNYPLIVLDRASDFSISDFFLHLGPSATGSHITQVGTASVPARSNNFINGALSGSVQSGGVETGTANIPYFVDHQAGILQFSNVSLNGTPTSSYFHVGASVGADDFKLKNVRPANRALLITDDRTDSFFGYGTIPLVRTILVGAGVDEENSVNRTILRFTSAGTNQAVMRSVLIPSDAVPGRPVNIRTLWYSDGATGNFNLEVGVKQLNSSGSDITVGETDFTSVVTVPGTANRTTTTTFTTNVNVKPGDYIAPLLARIGGTGGDTSIYDWRVLGADLLYERAL